MLHLNSLKILGIHLYLSIYLIFPYSAITQTIKVDIRRNLEKALNSRNLEEFLPSNI